MNETDGTPTEAGCIVTPDDEEAPVSNGFAILLALAELKRAFWFLLWYYNHLDIREVCRREPCRGEWLCL